MEYRYFAAAVLEVEERQNRDCWLEDTAECYATMSTLADVKQYCDLVFDLWPRFTGRILAWDVNGDWVLARRYKFGKLVDSNALPAGKHWPWLAMLHQSND